MWLRRVFQGLKASQSEPEAAGSKVPQKPAIEQITPRELRDRLGDSSLQLVDVREEHELRYCSIDGAVHIPMRRLMGGGETDLDPSKAVVVYCHRGVRSMLTAYYLAGCGFNVLNLKGGIHAWSEEVDPNVPTY